MISLNAAWAIVLRHFYMYKQDINSFLMILYWPFLDVLIWGFLGSWIQQTSQSAALYNYELVALMGILMWQPIGRGSNIIGITFIEELWTNNVVNLFSLPFKIIEWIIGVIFFYVLVTAFTLLVSMSTIFFLYQVNMWAMLWTMFIFLIPLLISGIWLGFVSLSILILIGKRGIELSWVVGWFLLPFSGAYYPVEVLPGWAKAISSVLPMSYLFHGMREYLTNQANPLFSILKGSLLGFFYMIFSISFFVYSFNLSKKKGLSRLMD